MNDRAKATSQRRMDDGTRRSRLVGHQDLTARTEGKRPTDPYARR